MEKAKDIMTVDPKTLSLSDHFGDAVKLFLEKSITSIPIVDDKGGVVGVFTEQGLVKAFVLSRSGEMDRQDLGAFKSFFEQPMLMPEDSGVLEVMKGLISSRTYRILVTDRSKSKLIGIISPRDIMRSMSRYD